MKQKQFLDLILPFQDRLYRVAKRLLISSEEAEDAVQEVILKLWNIRQQIDEYRSVEAYALTMMKNHCLDRLKSKQAGNLKIEHTNYATSENVERSIEANDGVALVFKLMDNLPFKQKVILQLRDVEQLEFAEIAEIMETNETTVRVTLSRARKTIREELTKKYDYGIK